MRELMSKFDIYESSWNAKGFVFAKEKLTRNDSIEFIGTGEHYL